MYNQPLIDYIKRDLAVGTSIDAVRAKIIAKGWSPADADAALRVATGGSLSAPQSIPTAPPAIQAKPPVPWLVRAIATLSFIGGIIAAFFFFAILYALSIFGGTTSAALNWLIVAALLYCSFTFYLAYSLYHGRNWARIVYLVLACLAALSGVVYVTGAITAGVVLVPIKFLSALINVCIAGYLAGNSQVIAAFTGK